jgi:hypothetical protein
MLAIVQVRLTSHFLGELKPDSRGVRRFKMNIRSMVSVNQTGWLEDMVFAAHTMKLEVNVRKTIVPPEGILPASIHLLRRTYSGAHVEFFESFRKGTILTFDMVLHDEKPRCPTLEQLGRILEFTGDHCGISQWGKKFGFGRFLVVNVIDRYATNGELPASDKTHTPEPSPASDIESRDASSPERREHEP